MIVGRGAVAGNEFLLISQTDALINRRGTANFAAPCPNVKQNGSLRSFWAALRLYHKFRPGNAGGSISLLRTPPSGIPVHGQTYQTGIMPPPWSFTSR